MKLNQNQKDALTTARQTDFYHELAQFFAAQEPQLFATLSADEQRSFAKMCHRQSEAAGLQSTAAIYGWADFSILLGSGFASDPYFAPIPDELSRATAFTEEDHIERAQDWLGGYLKTVRGPQAEALKASFGRLRDFLETAHSIGDQGARNWSDVEEEQLRLSQQIYPELTSHHDAAATTARIQHFLRQAHQVYGLQTMSGLSIYTQLGMAMGADMDRDLLYPWVARTLARGSDLGAEAMGAQLASKAVTWFDAVLEPQADTKKEVAV